MFDAIAETVKYLKALIDAPVASEVPAAIPETFCAVRRTGGNGDRFVDNPQIAVHCWAASDAKAGSLAKNVASLMLESPDHIMNLAAITQNSIYQNNLDGRHRWTVTFGLTVNR